MARKLYSLLIILVLSSQVYAQKGKYLKLPTQDYVELYNFSPVSNLKSGTISFWFRIQDLNTSVYLFGASSEKSVASRDYSDFFITYRTKERCLQVVININGKTIMDAYNPYFSIMDKKWHHCTVVSDKKGAIEIYLDGVKQSITAGTCCGGTTADHFFADIPEINNIKVGALKRDAFLPSGSVWMDEFIIWKKALSAEQVNALVKNELAVQPAETAVYYDFEEQVDLKVGKEGINDIQDRSGNQVNGDVIEMDGELFLQKGCYVEVRNFKPVAALQSGTISFWFKLSDLNSDVFLFGASNEQSIASLNYSDFYITYRGGDKRCIQVVANVKGSTYMDVFTPGWGLTFTNTTWHNCTVVSDDSGEIQVYIDGVLQRLMAGTCCGGTTADYFLGDLPDLTNMKIGALKRDDFLESAPVSFDDFRIWDIPLTEEEILKSIAAPSPAGMNHLLLYYDFEDLERMEEEGAEVRCKK